MTSFSENAFTLFYILILVRIGIEFLVGNNFASEFWKHYSIFSLEALWLYWYFSSIVILWNILKMCLSMGHFFFLLCWTLNGPFWFANVCVCVCTYVSLWFLFLLLFASFFLGEHIYQWLPGWAAPVWLSPPRMCWVLLVLVLGYFQVLCQSLGGTYCNLKCTKPILLSIIWPTAVLNNYRLPKWNQLLGVTTRWTKIWLVIGQLYGPAPPNPVPTSFVGLGEGPLLRFP